MTTSDKPTRLQRFRERRNEFMRTHHNSPLTENQQENFVPPDYYEENPDLAFVVEPNTDIPHDPVPLGTTSGEAVEYIPHSTITFEVEGKEVTLTVYREPGRGRLLIPFKDATCGDETYGAGRTVDPQERPDGKLSVDFNYAYGPYCQYNDNWVCTLPPFNNWINDIPIRAGEKKYPNKESEYPD